MNEELTKALAVRRAGCSGSPHAGSMSDPAGQPLLTAASSAAAASALAVLSSCSAPHSTTPAPLPRTPQDDASLGSYYSDWKRKYDGGGSQEAFKANLQRMVEHNARSGITYWMAPTQWSDLTYDAFAAVALGLRDDGDRRRLLGGRRMQAGASAQRRRLAAPDKVDWLEAGKVTPVKHQSRCGSCWAHASLAALESKALIEGKGQLDLSEQEVVDCAAGHCKPWYIAKALDFIHQRGVAAEAQEPYTAAAGACAADRLSAVARIPATPGYTRLPANSRSALQEVRLGAGDAHHGLQQP